MVEQRAPSRTLLVAAVAVILAVAAVVVIFGIESYPSLPTVAEQPDPEVEGSVAVLDHTVEGPCLRVVDGAGAADDLGCDRRYEGGGLRWEDEETLRLTSFMGPEAVDLLVDLESGQVSRVPAEPQGDRLGPLDLVTGRSDGVVWLEVRVGGTVDRVLALQAPDSYDLFDARWVSGRRWVVVRDSLDRLLVVDTSGEAGPRIWVADDLSEFAVS